MAIRVFCILFIALVLPDFSVAQEHPMVVESILKSMKWADNIGSYELEITTTKNRKTTLKGSSDATFGETIEKFREFRKGDVFWISSAFGVTLISTINGQDKIDEAISMSYKYGDSNFAKSKSTLPSGEVAESGAIQCGPNSTSCVDVSRGFVLGRIVLQYALDIPKDEMERGVDRLLEKILNAKQWHVSESTTPQKTKCLVYRFSDRANDKTTFAYKIVVSDEGVDKGYVTQINRFKMKREELNRPYQDDDQVVENSCNSVSSMWREVETAKGKRVLLLKLVQESINGANSKVTKSWDFNWKSFSAPQDSLMTEESCQKICSELAKQIDRALGR